MRLSVLWKSNLLALAACLALASTIAGQTPPTAEAPRVRAMRVAAPIKIDGRLDEPAWALAEPATDFRMKKPKEGAPASERTEARVLIDDKNIYFGIHAFDSEPDKINARELTRDADLANDDKIEILLDTNHDHRNAYR